MIIDLIKRMIDGGINLNSKVNVNKNSNNITINDNSNHINTITKQIKENNQNKNIIREQLDKLIEIYNQGDDQATINTNYLAKFLGYNTEIDFIDGIKEFDRLERICNELFVNYDWMSRKVGSPFNNSFNIEKEEFQTNKDENGEYEVSLCINHSKESDRIVIVKVYGDGLRFLIGKPVFEFSKNSGSGGQSSIIRMFRVFERIKKMQKLEYNTTYLIDDITFDEFVNGKTHMNSLKHYQQQSPYSYYIYHFTELDKSIEKFGEHYKYAISLLESEFKKNKYFIL